MGQVTVRVGGYAHTIGCKDGEEAHVQELAAQIENKTKLIRSMGGQFSEARMLLHVALLLADEAGDLRAEMARASAVGGGGASADPFLAERLTRIAERVETLAGRIAAHAEPPPPPSFGDEGAPPAAGRG